MVVLQKPLGILDNDYKFVMGMQYQRRDKYSCSCNC